MGRGDSNEDPQSMFKSKNQKKCMAHVNPRLSLKSAVEGSLHEIKASQIRFSVWYAMEYI